MMTPTLVTGGDLMIRFKLKEMLSEKAFREGKRINLDELSDATGVNKSTLSRISSVRGYNTTTDNIDKLCRFFGCSVDKLIEYVPDEEVAGLDSSPQAP
jgi:DNA-binding Xre family transcriptional regulator